MLGESVDGEVLADCELLRASWSAGSSTDALGCVMRLGWDMRDRELRKLLSGDWVDSTRIDVVGVFKLEMESFMEYPNIF